MARLETVSPVRLVVVICFAKVAPMFPGEDLVCNDIITMVAVSMAMLVAIFYLVALVGLVRPRAMGRVMPNPVTPLLSAFFTVVVVVVVVMHTMPVGVLHVAVMLYPLAVMGPRVLVVLSVFPPQHRESPRRDNGTQACLEQVAGSVVVALRRLQELVARQCAGGKADG